MGQCCHSLDTVLYTKPQTVNCSRVSEIPEASVSKISVSLLHEDLGEDIVVSGHRQVVETELLQSHLLELEDKTKEIFNSLVPICDEEPLLFYLQAEEKEVIYENLKVLDQEWQSGKFTMASLTTDVLQPVEPENVEFSQALSSFLDPKVMLYLPTLCHLLNRVQKGPSSWQHFLERQRQEFIKFYWGYTHFQSLEIEVECQKRRQEHFQKILAQEEKPHSFMFSGYLILLKFFIVCCSSISTCQQVQEAYLKIQQDFLKILYQIQKKHQQPL